MQAMAALVGIAGDLKQLKQLRQLFAAADTDGSKALDEKEFYSYGLPLGHRPFDTKSFGVVVTCVLGGEVGKFLC
jgi:hypothetical protein